MTDLEKKVIRQIATAKRTHVNYYCALKARTYEWACDTENNFCLFYFSETEGPKVVATVKNNGRIIYCWGEKA